MILSPGNMDRGFIRQQRIFTGHVRDPEHNPAPVDVDSRRMNLYCELLYANTEVALADRFPTLKEILSEDCWHTLVRDFFNRHKSRSPYFPEFSLEFMEYLDNERTDTGEDPAFMKELAHYEWIEYAMYVSADEITLDGIDMSGDLLEGIPVLSPLVKLLQYHYPVHKINRGYQPDSPSPEPVYIIVYRNKNDQVEFQELNVVSAQLVEMIRVNEGSTGRQILEKIAQEIHHPNHETVIHAGQEIMQDMLNKDILLGTKY